MRAIFAYLASGDWTDVLEEDALPLKDRIGVALRFLPDDEVRSGISILVLAKIPLSAAPQFGEHG